jgi:voltage-gated potassium channel
VGRNVAHELIQTNRHFVAIDPDEMRLQESQEKYPGLLYLAGDASDDDLLIDAYIAEARGVFAVTGDDSRNLMITLTAKQLNPNVRVVARCNEVRNVEKLKKAGADTVVSPDFTGGMRIASAMIRPQVVTFLDEMLRSEHKLRVEEILVPEEFAPATLGSLSLRSQDYVLLAVRTGADWTFNPEEDFLLKPGYHLIAMASPHGRQEIEAALLPVVDDEGNE